MNGQGERGGGRLGNLQLRIISGIILAAVVLSLTWLGGLPFRVLAAVIGAAVFYEWSAMVPGGIFRRVSLAGAVLLALNLLALIAGYPASVLLICAAATIAVSALLAVAHLGSWRATGGLAYAVLPAIALALLRGGDGEGLLAILYLFAVVWSTDILAYFVGRAIGGPKLAPSISPGKTWSGAIGGATAAVVAGAVFAIWLPASPVLLGVVALALSAVSQVGDLFESKVKRVAGVKDSSHLIPGHGGVMDRVDGLVAAAVALYLIGAATGGVDHPARMLFGG